MKKLMTAVLLLLSAAVEAQDKNFESCPLDVIANNWKAKTIDKVANGSLGVMLECFDKAWPTWMMGEVRKAMEKGLSEVVLNGETGLTVAIDSKNGFVEVGDEGTDGEHMAACYWNRSNGHKLLAVNMSKPVDPEIEFVCFYDYDPQKKTLTPEPEIVEMLQQRFGDAPVAYILPKKGKELRVRDCGNEGGVYVFDWDGMKPVYLKTESLEYDGGFTDMPVKFKGKSPNIKDFVSARFSDGEGLGECLGDIASSWEQYLQGKPLDKGCTFVVDTANGFMRFDRKYTGLDRKQMEMCYWNCSDGNHKLVAENIEAYANGRQIDTECTGWQFFMYDINTHRMKPVGGDDLGFVYDFPLGNSNTVSIALPRQGKTVVLTCHTPSGKITKRLTWNGSKFVKE